MLKKLRDYLKNIISHVSKKVVVSGGLMAWTPLISSSDFTGIQADVGTVVTGMITIFLVIAGFAVLVRVFSR